ncbi:IclR family transcriptional regulator [Saccharopolyspora kobensis]|uniref:IclR family transcriptional regulator n=1 Tax=Saccharopolyspora kobensis TaxID=146035 RepID=UPI000D3F3F97|nr:IclR family transcriptional regulator [Saccharopolyspora kobensis]
MTSAETNRKAGGRAARILAVFAEQESATAEEISASTGIPSSAVYRHLTAFVEIGLVHQGRTRGRYCAGSLTVQMAENYRREVLNQGGVRARLRRLATDTDELAAFLIARDNDVLCIEAAEGTRVIRCSFSPGLSKPLTFGASAQALLAHLPGDRVSRAAAAHGLTTAQAEKLASDLRRVRDQGFAVSVGQVDPGVWGVSVPVLGRNHDLVGVVSTMAPDFRVRARRESLITLTHAAAQDISRLEAHT